MMITVQGSATQYHLAERANLQLQVSIDGPEKAQVLEQAAAQSTLLQNMIAPLTQAAPGATPAITMWAADQVRVSAQRPWNNDGQQLPFVFTATAEFELRFADFSTLNTFYLNAANLAGVTIHGINWELTEPTKLALSQTVQGLAVHNAQVKALTYARAIKEQAVRCVALADVGMLGNDGPTPKAVAYSDSMARSAMGGPSISLKPQDIEITYRVDAQFETVAGPLPA